MLDIIPEVIEGVGLLVMLAAAHGFAGPYLKRLPEGSSRSVVIGLMFGVVIVFLMLDPVELENGIIWDFRGAPAVLSALYGGPVAAIVAGIIGAAGRYFLIGGPAAPGASAAFAAYAIFSLGVVLTVRVYGLRFNTIFFATTGFLGTLFVLPFFFIGQNVMDAISMYSGAWPYLFIGNVLGCVVLGLSMETVALVDRNNRKLKEKNTEDALLSLVARRTTNAVIISDGRGVIEWVNEGFETVSGYTVDEVVGRKPMDFLFGTESNPHSVDYMRDQIAKGEGFRVEIINYKKSGTTFWGEIFCQPLETPGEPLRFVFIMNDTTLRKNALDRASRAEQVLVTALNAIEDGFVLYDKEDRLVLANERYRDLYSLSRDVISPGHTFEEIIRYGVERGQYDAAIGQEEEWIEERLRLHAQANQSIEQQLSDGRWLRIHETRTPEGGIVGLRVDVTELKKAQSAAEQANNAKSEFLAAMSHEIRTPMTGVMGMADMLLEDDLPESSRKKVDQIKEATLSLLNIINDILDVSKLDAGKMTLESIPFNPAKLSDEVVTLFAHSCPEEKRNRLRIELDVEDGYPEGAMGDPTRLRQVLVNLVGNAVKFTNEGSVTLSCTLEQDMLVFAVTDTGVGIDQDYLSIIFDEFTQADASVSREYHGTGLGLAICLRLVSLMGGDINVESQLGEGSCFTIKLPYEAATLAPVEQIDQDVKFDRSYNILVAEDVVLNQQIIRALLVGAGHEVEFASNGEEVLELHRHKNFDLILMDIRMPVMSGTEAAMTVRAMDGDKGNVPIIALTADVIEENRRSYFNIGMNECIAKPINKRELFSKINAVMKAEERKKAG